MYGAAARARRNWYAARPDRRRRLVRPVISVGNLAAGGTGKTPVVAQIARELIALGHRPAILSRGYGRLLRADGVVVVSNGTRVLADVARAGDEPLMLARSVPGAVVCVSSERYLAGRLAESRFGATVHVLDDGFQHVQLERDVDLVIVRREDVERGRPYPSGRLREAIETASLAQAIVVPRATVEEAAAVAHRVGASRVFRTTSAQTAPLRLDTFAAASPVATDAPALAVAGIAEPQRFFDDLVRNGWTLVGTMRFRDHHVFTRADVTAIAQEGRAAGAELLVTTEKDAMRLLPFRPFAMPLAWVPLTVTIEPAAAFRQWLVDRMEACAPSGTASNTSSSSPSGSSSG